MLSGGTIKDIFLSITDDDISGDRGCRKYPEEKYNFTWASPQLIMNRDRIRKAFSVYDAIPGSPDRDLLGQFLDAAVMQFRTIFGEIQDYSRDSEPGVSATMVHDRISDRVRAYLLSVMTRGRWDNEKPDSVPNTVLDAYFLALQLEQQSREIPDVGTLKSQIKDLEGQAKTVAESLGKSAGVEVLRTFGQHYETEATAQIKPSRFWLWAGVVPVVLLIIVISCFYLNMGCSLFGSETSSMNWTDPHTVSNIIGRIVLLSIFAFLARFGFHQYSIRMHQLSAYRQKEVLANTFELFLASETMAERRDLIMREVIGSLATFVPDGYIRKDAPELHPLGEIARLLASFKGKGDK